MAASMIRLEICRVDFCRHSVGDIIEVLTRLGVCFNKQTFSEEIFMSLFPSQSLVNFEF